MMPEQVARKSKKTDNFCSNVDFKGDTFRKLYPGPFESINPLENNSPNTRHNNNSKLPETTN